MSKTPHSSSAYRKSSLQPFLLAMLLVMGFHFAHNFDFTSAENEGTFFEINNTKLSTPFLTFQKNHYADIATFEKEEKEEKTESESHFGFAIDNNKYFSVGSFFLISGAATHSLKIPSGEGKTPLYILFQNFRVHLA